MSDNSSNRGMLRATLSIGAITLVSRILGLFREQVRAHLLGTSLASDAFGIAFQIPNLLRRLVAEGAVNAGFIPIFSRERERGGDRAAFTFAVQFWNLSLIVMLLVSILGVVFAGTIVAGFVSLGGGEGVTPAAQELTTELTRIMFPYIALVAWAAVAQGILNTFRVFWVSATTSILLNIAVIVFAIGMSFTLDQPAYGFAFGVIAGGALQLVFQLPFVFRLGFKWRPDFQVGEATSKALKLLLPTIFGAGVYQINVLVSQAIAWGIGEGAVSSLQYSGRLLELTLGVFAVALATAALPSFAANAAAGEHEVLARSLRHGISFTIFVCVPVTAGLVLLRFETVSLLFERGSFDRASVEATAQALYYHMAGLSFIAICRLLTPVYYAYKDTWTPFWAGVGSMVANIVLCYLLAGPLRQGGVALANSVSALVQLLILAALLGRHLRVPLGPEVWWSGARTVAAAALMAVVVVALSQFFGSRELSGLMTLSGPYVAIVAVAVVVYAFSAWLLGSAEVREVVAALRRRST